MLYELVAPKNALPQKDAQQGENVLSSFQTLLSDLLDVHHQLDLVDYRKANFVHADLSFPDLIAEGKRRGETPLTLFAGITLDALRLVQKAEYESQRLAKTEEDQLQTVDDLLKLISDPTRLRLQFAKVLAQSEEDGIAGFTTLAPYLIDARNKAAIEVLKQELAKGKKKIAIFYGAAHLPDFEQRLIKEFDMGRVETRWLKAWSLDRSIPKRDPLQLFIQMFRSLQQSGAA